MAYFQIEPKLKEILAEPPILALKRNKHLRDMIGSNKVFDKKIFLNDQLICCKQLKTCATFQIAFNKRPF